jgi:hypothetical protein
VWVAVLLKLLLAGCQQQAKGWLFNSTLLACTGRLLVCGPCGQQDPPVAKP